MSIQHVVIANFGNESIALIQWCLEQQIDNLTVVSVETGWQAEIWDNRVTKAGQWLSENALNHRRIKSPHTMPECVNERGSFPNKKLQWCAGFLKGLALNDFLDEIDASCEAVLLFAKRRKSSRANQWLEEYAVSEHFNDRKLWHPILEMSDERCREKVQKAGFQWLPHQSLECMPCIHPSTHMLQALTKGDIARVSALEQRIQKTMFEKPIHQVVEAASLKPISQKNYLEQLDMGCGSEFGCGE